MGILQLLSDLSGAFGPSGFEDDVVAVARRHSPDGAVISEDSLRNLIVRRPGDAGSDKPVVLLDAHTDEVGFMVQAIRPNGLMTLVPLGGWVGHTVPAHTVRVKNRDGELVTGVIATKPPHFLTEEQRKASPELSSMTLDVGACSAEEVERVFRIGVGAPAAPDVSFTSNAETGICLGKAFDCRAGCAAALAAFGQVFDRDLPSQPVVALASQEEVGMRGAAVTARTVRPAAAICFEGSPADDSFAEPWAAQTGLKRGPMLRHIDQGMITNPRFIRFAIETGAALGMPIQQAVRSGGRTNGAAIHLSGRGVPTLVIGIPVRYIHTHYGYMSLRDVEQCVALGVALIERLTPDIIAGF